MIHYKQFLTFFNFFFFFSQKRGKKKEICFYCTSNIKPLYTCTYSLYSLFTCNFKMCDVNVLCWIYIIHTIWSIFGEMDDIPKNKRNERSKEIGPHLDENDGFFVSIYYFRLIYFLKAAVVLCDFVWWSLISLDKSLRFLYTLLHIWIFFLHFNFYSNIHWTVCIKTLIYIKKYAMCCYGFLQFNALLRHHFFN